MVFVDDAVRGTLPEVCAKDGAPTTDRMVVGGVLSVIVGEVCLRTAGVRVDLDASRRWVTLSPVHPSFVAACQAHEQRQPQRA